MKKNALITPTETIKPIIKVTHVEVTSEGRTERELTGEELEDWKKSHGINVEQDGEGTK